MARIRTIPQVMAEIKTIDPDTAITEYYVRTLVNNGQIPHIKAGSKILLDLDIVLEYFNMTV